MVPHARLDQFNSIPTIDRDEIMHQAKDDDEGTDMGIFYIQLTWSNRYFSRPGPPVPPPPPAGGDDRRPTIYDFHIRRRVPRS